MPEEKYTERLKNAFATGDRAWNAASARTSAGEIACRAGCFGCCIGLFEISIPEAELVRVGLERLSTGDREDAVLRATRIVSATAAAFPGDAVTGLLDPDRTEEADDAYFELVADRACPMLELPSGRCRIYEERPMTCRTFGFAWAREGELIHPPCGLNLPGATAARQLGAAIALEHLDEAADVDLGLSTILGLETGRETTVAHAIVGTWRERSGR